MNLTKTPYLVLFVLLASAGVGTASALITITFEGLTVFKENAQFDKDVNIDGIVTGQAITDFQNRISFLESITNHPPIVDLGPDQSHEGIASGSISICEGSLAFTIPAPGVTNDGLFDPLVPLVVKWKLNSQTGNTWSINGIGANPGDVFTEPITSVISWNGGKDTNQFSTWTVSAFDGQFTVEDTITLDCRSP